MTSPSGALTHPLLISQLSVAAGSLAQVTVFSALLSADVYADFVAVAAIWVVGAAFAGTIGSTATYRRLSHDGAALSLPHGELTAIACTAAISAVVASLVRLDPWAVIFAFVGIIAIVYSETKLAQLLTTREYKRYARWVSLRAAIPPAVVLILSCMLGPGLHIGFVLGIATASHLVVALGRPRLRFRVIRDPFLVPTIPITQTALWMIASADRVILSGSVASEVLIAYSITYGLADRAMRIPTTALSARLMPDAIRSGATTRFRGWILVVTLIALIAGLGGFAATPLLSQGRYETELSVALLISLGLFCYGLAVPIYIAALGAKKDIAVMGHTLTAGVINLVANFALIPAYSVTGAASATLVAYAYWLAALSWVTLRPSRRKPRHQPRASAS